MRPVFSDFSRRRREPSGLDGAPSSSRPAARFTSRVLDAGDSRAAWGTLTATGGGADVTFATRTGNSADTTDGSWSAFQAVGSGGAVASPMGRYIQYRATLTTTDPDGVAARRQVAIGYDIDDVKPRAAVDGVDVSGTTASVRFSSPDADVARLECSLDGGAFATCTSPKAFTGLTAGAHSVAVRAVDNAGNVGDAASRGFSIAAPPSTGGGGTQTPGAGGTTPPPAGGGTTAAKAVRASLLQRSVRASKGGIVKLRLKCLRGEKRCTITLRLKRGGKVVAVKTARIDVGATRTVSLRLSKSTRRALANKGSVKLSATLAARDTAGNAKSTTRSLTVKAPR